MQDLIEFCRMILIGDEKMKKIMWVIILGIIGITTSVFAGVNDTILMRILSLEIYFIGIK